MKEIEIDSMRFKVTCIVKQDARILLYGHPVWKDYYVIGNPNIDISIGDEIEYEEYGYNFGWLKSKVTNYE